MITAFVIFPPYRLQALAFARPTLRVKSACVNLIRRFLDLETVGGFDFLHLSVEVHGSLFSTFELSLLRPIAYTSNTAFILYRQHYQSAVAAQHPGLANPDISKIIGEQWRQQPAEVKNEWKILAEV